ncbi:MAG TPA: GNAT family N-acetyltransferase [Acidimicrobiia bacterium]|nr:GNAT family N-acetyltransferase [Acidimicrobiia bacterium]
MAAINVKVEGNWPGAVTLRRGWSRAECRPWNSAVSAAHLRMLRGGTGFIGDCLMTLGTLGVEDVLSPPLPRSAQRPWLEAGFQMHSQLELLRLDLNRIAAPDHLVAPGDLAHLAEALRIDAAAFDPFWRFDRTAMLEALQSTPKSALHIVRRPDGHLAGFAITGLGTAIAYLQRVAVEPDWQGQGLGRSLVRTSAWWAKRNGARSLMLNTQVENTGAIALYESEGFVTLPEPLAVLSAPARSVAESVGNGRAS